MKPLERKNLVILFNTMGRFSDSATLIFKKLYIDQQQLNKSDSKLLDYDEKKNGGYALLTKEEKQYLAQEHWALGFVGYLVSRIFEDLIKAYTL